MRGSQSRKEPGPSSAGSTQNLHRNPYLVLSPSLIKCSLPQESAFIINECFSFNIIIFWLHLTTTEIMVEESLSHPQHFALHGATQKTFGEDFLFNFSSLTD